MNKEDALSSINRNGALLAEAARRGVTPPVPSCPGWTVADLLVHIGEVHRFWTAQLLARSAEPAAFPAPAFSVPGLAEWAAASQEGKADPNLLPPGTVEWYEEGVRDLVRVLRATPDRTTVWHWSGQHIARSTRDMQVVETALHRWDAQSAHGEPDAIGADVAAHGIPHYFEVMMPANRHWGKPVRGAGERFLFHPGGMQPWRLTFTGDSVEVDHAGTADVEIAGDPEEMFLFLWGRRPADRLQVRGDSNLVERYRQLVPS